MKQSQLNEPCYISITWLPPRVEISKKIFDIAYYYTFASFTIPSSYFQVFCIFVFSFLHTFWFCLAFVFSGFTFLLYYQVFYFVLILSILPISLNVFRFSMSFIFSGFSGLSISSFLYYLFFYVFFFCLENTLSTDFCLEPSNVFLIPTMLKDWWLWWDIHRNGQIFYDLASLKLQSVVKINYEKMVGHLFIDSTSLVTQKALTCLVPRGEIFQIWPDQIAQNCHLRLLQRFLWVVPLHQTGDWWIWVHDKMCMKNISVSIAFNDTYMEKRDSVQKFMEIQGWLLLTFFICLHYQLSSFNSIIVQMSEKHDSSSRQ